VLHLQTPSQAADNIIGTADSTAITPRTSTKAVYTCGRRLSVYRQHWREQRQRTEDIDEGQQLEEISAPTPALLLHTGQQRFLSSSFQLFLTINCCRRLPFICHVKPLSI
jgi:hypothetical protein